MPVFGIIDAFLKTLHDPAYRQRIQCTGLLDEPIIYNKTRDAIAKFSAE